MGHPSVVILAAGKGKRMVSALPKVLHRLAGKPLLMHVLDAARALSAERIVVVYGHGGEAVPTALAGMGVACVLQEPQLGTGHALQQTLPYLPLDGSTLVLYGDVPLIRPQTLAAVLSHSGALCLLTAKVDDPTGYGRIVRDGKGNVTRIVEEKDASAAEKTIREINTGIVAAPNAALRDWLGKLTNQNAQGEYYLTDIVPLALSTGTKVVTESVSDPWEIQGINSREQLAALERRYQLTTARALMAGGVTLADPARLDVRGELMCSADVIIDIDCVFEGRVTLFEHVSIGAHCVIKDSEIGVGTVIAPFSHLDGARVAGHCRSAPTHDCARVQCWPSMHISATSSRPRTLLLAKARRPTTSVIWAMPRLDVKSTSARARSPAITTALTNIAQLLKTRRLSALIQRWSRP